MFGKTIARDLINHSAENETDRRLFLKATGLAGAGAVGATAVGFAGPLASAGAAAPAINDGTVLNFALNLEYLEAQFYHYAAFGTDIGGKLTSGKGNRGKVVGGSKVPFVTPGIASIAREIARDELAHVKFLRDELGGAKVAQPKIDLRDSFSAAAAAAGLVEPGQPFDPFADETSFLLAAYIFEDVGVTAYKGAAPLIKNKTYLEAAAGILAVEAYHAGIIRAKLYDLGLQEAATAISDARDSLDGKSNVDQGLGTASQGNLVPTDKAGIAYSRSPGQVLNVVYLNPKSVNKGGFFPKGVNGDVKQSAGKK